MDYNNIDELRNEWLSGNFQYPLEISIDGIPFRRRIASGQDFEEVIMKKAKAFVIYSTSQIHHDEAVAKGLNQWVILIWVLDNSVIKPAEIRSISPQRFTQMQVKEQHQERIGDVVILKIVLPSGMAALKGKVDTGADISSLHAENIQIMNNQVRFMNKFISNNIITVPVSEKQAVKSADGGITYRPVIELDIEINGKSIRQVSFNLTDRNGMEYPCLVGQNVLEKTNFLIDPSINDSEKQVHEDQEWVDDENLKIDFEKLNEEFKDLEPVILESVDHINAVAELYQALQNSNVTLSELIRHVRTDARKVMEDIKY